MHIVTVATKNEGYFNVLVESCRRNGGNLEVLGWNTEWKGFLYRIKLMNDYLQKLNDEEIVCFIDAYDVVILQPFSKIETLFRKSGKKILLSRDVNTNIITDSWLSFYYGKCKSYSINAGTYIGYVKYLKKMYNEIMKKYDINKQYDDQVIFTKLCQQINDIDIDISRELFLVINNYDKDINKVKIINKNLMFNNIYPCILHAPANYNINYIIKELGYSTNNIVLRNQVSYLCTFFKVERIQFLLIIIFIIIFSLIFIISKKIKNIFASKLYK